MKPPPFEYLSAATVEDAVALLAEKGDAARVLAGGQSLVPMMNFRLLEPEFLIDIGRIQGLDGIIEDAAGGLRIGALARHHALETSALVRERFPVLSEAMAHVAHLAVRNRGTIGGSLCHADPAAELPMMAVLLDATIRTAAPGGGRRIAARDFFVAPLTTALEEAEIVTEVALAALPAGAGWGFEEVARRDGDFALAGAAAILTRNGDRIETARIALMGLGETPLRADAAESLLKGQKPDAALFAAAADAARDATNPTEDLHASAAFRRHLAGVAARRALEAALRRAGGEEA